MKTFHFWLSWLLGSPLVWSEPYQTTSARPAPPPLIQGNTSTLSPATELLTCRLEVRHWSHLLLSGGETLT